MIATAAPLPVKCMLDVLAHGVSYREGVWLRIRCDPGEERASEHTQQDTHRKQSRSERSLPLAYHRCLL